MSDLFPLETFDERREAAERDLYRALQDALAAAGIATKLKCDPCDDGLLWTIEKVAGPVDIVALGRVCAEAGWGLSFREGSGFHFVRPVDWYRDVVDAAVQAAETNPHDTASSGGDQDSEVVPVVGSDKT